MSSVRNLPPRAEGRGPKAYALAYAPAHGADYGADHVVDVSAPARGAALKGADVYDAAAYGPAVYDAVPRGAEALHRSRRLSFLFLTAGLCAGLLALTLAQPVSSVRVSPPLAMDMRTLPSPSARPPVATPPPTDVAPLLAERAPYSVALPPVPPKPVEPEAVKPEAARPEPPAAEPVVNKPMGKKEKTHPRQKVRPEKDMPQKSVPQKPMPEKSQPVTPGPVSSTLAAAGAAGAGGASSANTASGTESGTASGVGAGAAGERDHAAALAVLLRAMERHKSYPRQARRTGAQGTASLLVQVGQDGKVTGWALQQSSGHTVLDSATRHLGEKLVGLDTGVRSGALRIVVPVNYRLQ